MSLLNPEVSWPRQQPLPTIDQEFISEALGAWPELAKREWKVLEGGLRSINLHSDDLVARIPYGEGHDLATEAAILRRVASLVRVPRVVDLSEQAMLCEYVAHVQLPDTRQAGQALGATASAIHGNEFPSAGYFAQDLTLRKTFSDPLVALREWAEPLLQGRVGIMLGGMADAMRKLWDQHGPAMVSGPPVLTHSDFKISNLKWLPQTGEVLVLDWEFAWAGAPLFDIGQLLRWNPPATFLTGFESAYRAGGGKLPERWQYLASLFDLFNMIAFLDNTPDQKRDQAVLQRIDDTLSSR